MFTDLFHVWQVLANVFIDTLFLCSVFTGSSKTLLTFLLISSVSIDFPCKCRAFRTHQQLSEKYTIF